MRTAALVIVLFVAGIAAVQAQVTGVAARVNGMEIGAFRLERHFDDFLKSRARHVATIRNPEVYKRLKREALDQLIDQELLWQEAQRRGITVPAGSVDEARAALAAGFGGEHALLRRIREAGFDEASYAVYLERRIAIQLTLDELVGEVAVSDQEVQSFIVENAARFASMPASDAHRTAGQILLRLRRDEARHNTLVQLRDRAVIELFVRL